MSEGHLKFKFHTMPISIPQAQFYSPAVLSLIPLYYVGWADSVLSPSEIKLIQEKIQQLSFLSDADRKMLKKWSNPAKPPSPKLFKYWVQLLQQSAAKLGNDSRQSLIDLGLEMAKRNATNEADYQWITNPATKTALENIQDAIGIVSIEQHRQIFSPKQRQLERANIITQTSFSVNCMKSILDDEYPLLRDRMRILLKDETFQYKTLPNKDDYRQEVLRWCKLLADQGLGALSYPKAQGGEDDMGRYAVVFEMLGYHDLSLAIKFGVQFGLFGGSVLFLGTQRHHDKYLKDTGTLQLAGCFAMTETGHGSNVRKLQTTATYDPNHQEFIIHTPTEGDGKEYIGNALHSKMASVFAQLIVDGENHGVHAILVPLRDQNHQLLKGIRVEDNGYKLGLNGVDNGRIWFDQVRVPRENLLNKYGDVNEKGQYTSPIASVSRRFFTMLGTLVGGRVCVPRAGLSATKSALTIAIKYASKRRQFAPNDQEAETILLDYPTHQRRLMPLLAKTYALDFALTYLNKRFVNRNDQDIREIESLAAGMKAYSTWFTTHAIQVCREACGGKGYLAENRFADLKADSDIFTTFEGDNTVLLQLVAKSLLSDFKKEFHDEGYRAVLRFIASQVSDTATSYNPFFTRNNDSNHLLDPDFHREAFQFRERKMLYTASSRIRALIKKQMSAYDAFLRVQTHLVDLAIAHIERIVVEKFAEAVANCEDPECQAILSKLYQLYALDTIQEHKGWYLENDYMTGNKTKAIRRLIAKLSKEIRNDALFLVEAFAIPEALLAAPIARN